MKDLRRQRIFAALKGLKVITLDQLVRRADVTQVAAVRELNRLHWVKRRDYQTGDDIYLSPMAQASEQRARKTQ